MKINKYKTKITACGGKEQPQKIDTKIADKLLAEVAEFFR